MPVQVNCPNPECGRRSRVADDLSGRPVRCKACGQTFVAGASTTSSAKPSSPPHVIPPGTNPAQQIGRFRVQERLGAGAFGTVYRAYDPQLDRVVALKVPNPGVLNSPSRVERFLREAKASAGLRHPNIVPLYDAGRDGESYYIASAFIEGRPLADEIPEAGMPFAQAARLTQELAAAVGYAHEQGVVHRDVKPANVLLAGPKAKRTVKLADFGLAKAHDDCRISGLTFQGEVAGTPAFMAPEQVTHYRVTKPPADQFSVAATLYNLLTGCYIHDFTGNFDWQLVQIVTDTPVPITDRRKDLPPGLAEVVHKALAREPEDRHPDVAAFRAALLPFAG